MTNWKFWAIFGAAIGFLFAFAANTAKSQAYNTEDYRIPSTEQYWGTESYAEIITFYFSHTHDMSDWYDSYGKACCGGKDCFPARPGSVKWTPDGIRAVMPDGGWALIPEDNPLTKPNPDKVPEVRPVACFYKPSPEVIAMRKTSRPQEEALYHNTAYRLRCLYSGKPRL